MRVNAWEGQILRFTSPDTGQDRWNFADGDLRAPMKVLVTKLTPELLHVKFCSTQLTGKLAVYFEGRKFVMKQQFSLTKINILLCSVAILSNTNIVFAQSSQSTVIVTGSRFEENLNEVPANVKVITRDEIENSSSNTIPQVLSQIGGLKVSGLNSSTLNLDASVDMGGFGPTEIGRAHV